MEASAKVRRRFGQHSGPVASCVCVARHRSSESVEKAVRRLRTHGGRGGGSRWRALGGSRHGGGHVQSLFADRRDRRLVGQSWGRWGRGERQGHGHGVGHGMVALCRGCFAGLSDGEPAGTMGSIGICLCCGYVIPLELGAGRGSSCGGGLLVFVISLGSLNRRAGKGGGPHLGRLSYLGVVLGISSSTPCDLGRRESIGLCLRNANGRVKIGVVILHPTHKVILTLVA